MATIVKQKLSGSTDGKGILVVATADPGTTIHTAVAGALIYDEVWLFCHNLDTVARELTIEYGGNTATTDYQKTQIPPKAGLFLVVPGLVLQNTDIIKAFGAAANVLVITGFVNQVQP